MTKAVIYARFSSHNQREESIEGQIRECKRFAEQNGFLIVGEYADRAISGRTDDRAEFQRMIRDSDKHRFDTVITYAIDRFARNRYDSAIYKARLKKNGIKVYYAKQYIPEGPEGILLESIMEGYAEYYSENLSMHVKRGLHENAMQAKVTGGVVPLGYKISPDHHYEIDPAGAKIVQEIYRMYAAGESMAKVIAHCNERGWKTSMDKAFTKNSLRRILVNTKYIGRYEYDGVIIEDGIPAIIDTPTFEKVQSMFQHNYTARARSKANEDYLLTTKLFCGHCGSPMIGESGRARNGQYYYYYKCSKQKKASGSCDKHTERKAWIEELVVKETLKLLTDDVIDRIAEKAAEILEKEFADKSMLTYYEQTLKDVEKRLANLIDLMEQGIVTASTKDRLLELEAQKKELLDNISRESVKKPLLSKDRIAFWLYSFKNGDVTDKNYQQKIIDTFVNSVYIFDTDGTKGRRIVFTFNISGQNTSTITVSDIGAFAPPNRANPNHIFFVKHVFGFAKDFELTP